MPPKKVILLACGSFNPLTFMHLRMFELARDHLHRTGKYQVVCGIFSPVHDSYSKKDLISSTHRCAMIKRAIQDSDWIFLSDWECKRLEHTRTRLVLQYHQNQVTSALSQENKKADEGWIGAALRHGAQPVTVTLLCGADLLESFLDPNVWLESDISTILKDHGIAVISRNGSNPLKFIYESDLLSMHQNNIHLVTEWITNEVSSTKIRRSLRRGESIRYLLPDPVITYIKENNLFGYSLNKLEWEREQREKSSPGDVVMSALEESGNTEESRIQIEICEDGTVRVLSDKETTV